MLVVVGSAAAAVPVAVGSRMEDRGDAASGGIGSAADDAEGVGVAGFVFLKSRINGFFFDVVSAGFDIVR